MNEKEANKRGRGGEKAPEGTDPALADIQNRAAEAYHAAKKTATKYPGVVEFQFRMRPTWNPPNTGWTDWASCSEKSFEEYRKTKVMAAWERQTRALTVVDTDNSAVMTALKARAILEEPDETPEDIQLVAPGPNTDGYYQAMINNRARFIQVPTEEELVKAVIESCAKKDGLLYEKADGSFGITHVFKTILKKIGVVGKQSDIK